MLLHNNLLLGKLESTLKEVPVSLLGSSFTELKCETSSPEQYDFFF